MKHGLTAPCRAVLGTFDGFHVGHRALFSRALELGKTDGLRVLAVVIDRPCRERLCSAEQRAALLQGAGADEVIVVPLDGVRDLSCQAFVDLLREEFGVCACVCGYDFRFGRGRAGDAHTLQELIPTCVVERQTVDGVPVSSTAIRSLIREGDVTGAQRLLGRSYALEGEVQHGKQLGRKMGFPTANLCFPQGMCLPRSGVYLSRAVTRDGIWNAVTNVGTRPTVNGADLNAESCLLGFEGDLYGSWIRVELLSFLRAEQRFESVGELEERIRQDVEQAEKFFAN